MKNITRQYRQRKSLSDKGRWAYFMQAVEPNSKAINEAFREHHPQWLQDSQRVCACPENFAMMRLFLRMSVAQCAAFLRVSEQTIRNWEKGKIGIPFSAFEVLRLVSESLSSRFSHKAWDGWFISREGKLVSPDYGKNGFTPEQLNWLSFQESEAVSKAKALQEDADNLRIQVEQLQSELEKATEANLKLREMFLSKGFVDELYLMKDRLDGLVKQVATAHIIPLAGEKEHGKDAAAQLERAA